MKKGKEIVYDYSRHIKIKDMVQLVNHLIRDKEYGYGFLLMIGTLLGYKVGNLLCMNWGNFVNSAGKSLVLINDGKSEPRPLTNFLQSFIEFVYIKSNEPPLDTSPFINIKNCEINTRNINRDLLKFQKKYSSIIGMPYPFESDTMRRVFGLSVWEKWDYQHAAIGALRKHFGHNSDKMTRKFLMIPDKVPIYKVKELYNSFNPKYRFEDIALK